VLQSAVALVAVVPLAHAQSVSVNATITGEIVPGVYGRVVLVTGRRRSRLRAAAGRGSGGGGSAGADGADLSARAAGVMRSTGASIPRVQRLQPARVFRKVRRV